MATPALRRTDKKDTSMFASFSESDIKKAQAEFAAKQKETDKKETKNVA